MSGKQILVIDDDNVIRMVVQRILERNGYAATLAANGHTGMNMIKTASPDLVLLDINLPDLDGYTLCAKIRAQDKMQNLPIILMTASDDPEDRARGFDQGADDFLTKPFSDDDLLIRLEAQFKR